MKVTKESVWIKNPHGVVVALPPYLAAERLKEAGYSLTEPEDVPLRKRYPLSGELTEEDEKRREHRQVREETPASEKKPEASQNITLPPGPKILSVAELEALPFFDLQKYAETRGVSARTKGMTKEVLIKLLSVEGK